MKTTEKSWLQFLINDYR